jgi:uridine kinase
MSGETGSAVPPRRVVATFADLAGAIRRASPRCGDVRLVAVDGAGGAGKSTFADQLSVALGGAPIVHTDDFASWDEPLDWWGRLEEHVLIPLECGQEVSIRPYDWDARRFGEPRVLPRNDVVILEGVSSSRAVVAGRLAFAVWIETPRAERLRRGIERDGPAMAAQWDQWTEAEDAHFAKDRPRERADLIVDGAPSIAHDAATEFVRVPE